MRVVAVLLCIAVTTGCAWLSRTSYVPTSGQAGKDMVWVPTPDDTVETMLDLAEVTADDFVVDLGSGDGRMVIGAARRGAKALGIEYNAALVALSRQNARDAGVQQLAKFREADIFKTDFDGQRLELSQHFQSFTGTLGGQRIEKGVLNGAAISFLSGGRTFAGRVSDDGRRIVGDGWTAVRQPSTPLP